MIVPSWRTATLAVSCIIAAGCSSPAKSNATQQSPHSASNNKATIASEATSSVAVPIATSPEVTSIWAYLVDRYDTDGDGTVSAEEYDRREGQFDRWDRDENGELTAADFEKRKRSGKRRDPMIKGKTKRTLARYFQVDGNVKLLPLDEAQAAFAVYDGSDGSASDGKITEGEFTCSMEDRHMAVPGDDSKMVQRSMGKGSPWSVLIAGLDNDKDQTIVLAELERFYSKGLGTDVIDYSDWGSNRPSPRTTEASATKKGDDLAAQEGQQAPNFTLSSPDGTTTATLSQHVGDKPVALIFGSYT